MTNVEFVTHWQRLINRFGPKAMDPELERLTALEVCVMSALAWSNAVDAWIGSRKHTDPPRLAEFREAKLAEERARFQRDLKAAVDAYETRPLNEVLKRLGYGGCKTLWDAVEIEKLRRQTRRANGEVV